jgi:4-hydroxysphinganine ceramide fatty acyl 2-hydroxylase
MENSRKISIPKLIEEKFIVKYKNDLFDITKFMSKHPGGVNTLSGYNQKNIDEKFQSVEHSPAAKYLLNEYKMTTQQLEMNNNELDESMEVSREVAVK